MEAPGKSIAVLPFENLSGDKEQEYFSDGIAEEILNALARIKNLKVAGRTSSFRFKGENVDIQEVGEKLKVGTVLEGSVRRQGDRVKISVRLLNVEDGYQLWAAQFESTLTDMFKNHQEEIAVAISQRLKVSLLQTQSLELRSGHTQNSEAYDAVLKGRYFWDKRALKESEKYFKQAIELDPNMAAAYVGLAETYAVSFIFRYGSPAETMRKRRKPRKKLFNWTAHSQRHTSSSLLRRPILIGIATKQRPILKKAFQENYQLAQGYYWYAQYLDAFEADFEGAIDEMKKAVEIEPLGIYSYVNLGNGLFIAKKFKEALEVYKFSIQLNNVNPLSHLGSGFCDISGLENWGEAQKDIRNIGQSKQVIRAKAMLVHFYVKSGNKLRAQELYDELVAPTRTGYSSQYHLSLAASLLRKKILAHEHFKKAIEQHDSLLPFVINFPIRFPNDVLSDPRNIGADEKTLPVYERPELNDLTHT